MRTMPLAIATAVFAFASSAVAFEPHALRPAGLGSVRRPADDVAATSRYRVVATLAPLDPNTDDLRLVRR